ncbi:2-succinyl-5-enolpyruvyl-6-hydroxy-3-cyclohexene-1-carboxylic-acid synthase [soil metagenome]
MSGSGGQNLLWADLLVEELSRCGVGLFCVSPGARSAPLALALARRKNTLTVVHFDERATAFAAIGYARATGRPACWITTSGSAVANGLPAVVEADADGLPLILLTADRPPELRNSGANQTIRQPGIFGRFVRWEVDLSVPTTAIAPAFVLSTVDEAVSHAVNFDPGPVHVNVMFREPLLPNEPTARFAGTSLPSRWLDSEKPFTQKDAAFGQPTWPRDLVDPISASTRGVIISGRMNAFDDHAAVERLAEHLGWPLLPDIGSQLRLGAPSPSTVAYYDQALGSQTFRARIRPDVVLQFGGRPTSKRLAQALAEWQPEHYVVTHPRPARLDPDHIASHQFNSSIGSTADALRDALPTSSSDVLPIWKRAAETVEHSVESRLVSEKGLTEPAVARAITRLIPSGHSLFAASSMPIRDLDMFASTEGQRVAITSNRGASGIDGTIATAAGFSLGTGQPTTVLMGDLAFLYDLNALAMLRSPNGIRLTIVVLNNDGGGIFNMLPLAEHQEAFERFIATPHGIGFEYAASMFGLAYSRPESIDEFAVAYSRATASSDSMIIEVRSDRVENAELHRELLHLCSEAVQKILE